jgi:hypothetical protein
MNKSGGCRALSLPRRDHRAGLGITPAEMREGDLRALGDEAHLRANHYQRTVESRRRAGVKTREEYLHETADMMTDRARDDLEILTLLGSVKAFAEHLGISYEAAKKRAQKSKIAFVRTRGQGVMRCMVA